MNYKKETAPEVPVQEQLEPIKVIVQIDDKLLAESILNEIKTQQKSAKTHLIV